MEQSVTSYLKYLNIPISDRYCKKRIASHPDYPSILAVADTLQQFGIIHTTVKVDKENLKDLPLPALLHLNTAGGTLLPIYDAKELEVSKEKLVHWSGVMIKAEPSTEVTDQENAKALDEDKRSKIFTSILILAMVGLVTIPLSLSFSWWQLLLIVTALTGVCAGYVLFAKDLGITYQTVESFCNAGTGAGCGKVFSSDEGKLFGFIAFSDLTLGYFLAQFFAVGLLVPLWQGSDHLMVLGWVSMFAVPMIGYSLWLQAVKIKEWCRLCLVVNGVLAIQALSFGYIFYSGIKNTFTFALPEVVVVFILFGLVGSSLILLKQTIQQKNQAVQNEIAAARIKNSPEVFTSLLFKQRQVDTTPFKNDFLIGKPDAPIRLTMAVNLFCTPCKYELEHAKELLRIYPGRVSLSLRFLRSRDNGESSDLLLKAWLRESMKMNYDISCGNRLIDIWYQAMDKEKFKNFYPVSEAVSDTEIQEYLQTHYSWVAKAGVTKTPTTFVNGFELPDLYRIRDLLTFVPGLSDMIISGNIGMNK